MGKVQRITLNIHSDKHPELTQFIKSLPAGTVAVLLRDKLTQIVKEIGPGQGDPLARLEFHLDSARQLLELTRSGGVTGFTQVGPKVEPAAPVANPSTPKSDHTSTLGIETPAPAPDRAQPTPALSEAARRLANQF